LIDIKDFLDAANIHRVGYADFHNERIPSLLLSSEDQKRPEPVVTTKNGIQGGYQKNSMLVVSKIDVLEK
jgi:hypothetical protein